MLGSKSTPWHVLWFVLTLSLSIGGCGTPGVTRSGSTVTIDQKPASGEGHLLLKVQSARPSTLFNPKWQMVSVSGDNGSTIGLSDISGEVTAGSLFFARLPAGTYSIDEVSSVGPGPGLLLALMAGDSQNLQKRKMEFTVRASELSNLGTIVDSPPIDKDPESERVVLLRNKLGQDAAREELELLTGQKISLPENAGWVSEDAPQEASHALQKARALISEVSFGEDALGSFIYGGTALGQILFLDREGVWRSESLDSLATVSYARRLSDGTLLAGSDYGRVFVRKPGARWLEYRLPETNGLVAHIEPLGGGDLFVITRNNKGVTGYQLTVDGTKITQIVTVETVSLGVFPGVLVTADNINLVKNSGGFSREVEIISIDKRSMKINRHTEKYLVVGYQRLRNGEIFLSRYNDMNSYLSLSVDDGKTWEHGQTRAPLWPYFVDSKLGYALDFNRGIFSVDSFLVKTTDGGKSWHKTGSTNTAEIAGRVIGVGPGGEVYARLGWEIMKSSDEGESWQREFPVLFNQ